MDISITKMSSKGQIVIPVEMRRNIKEGEKLIIIQNKDQIIMKKASSLDQTFNEELEFAKRTEEAVKRIESNKGIKMEFDDFINEMKKW
ncbi:AbrB/MazE/SpoVT family DNA-binding domain-containing protein [Candidatus Woesearchaeota archaeon]|jgi:AbrB family looped-hinge helix DNA binding protein|nr:AbrB/MazE/SpoVT family DNA-binding domain-containing protein [Candidatus Woesearchaeota archaeon]MBT4387108.1 AbrB/MazE/SpoVT family DNA-binding domain-containing protein [Candidatus Woesearchaeota archaeon]MBT4596135.1 AbrB/MazE/SpoVT family DNA-binding domain-containing protein [Candidatus Woesearchaeota archaeon]MBT5741642.1 AbrB/MazE/SpoVT family DNA-binding domain-containing protein [Candidatus Woesearchaeota archaeon]MBT6505663.1 AbrB/MazE/SpoVT family DNA-binding domain-containing pro